MEKRLNKRIDTYIIQFKEDIRNKISNIKFEDTTKIGELLEYIYEYEKLSISKDDFLKRKRVKNSIPDMNRCNAKRANGEQCTRRRKNDCEYCGTHHKNSPHGLIEESDNTNNNKIIEIFAEDIKGIVYYLDNFNNIYKTTDILDNKPDPQIIAKYRKNWSEYIIYDL